MDADEGIANTVQASARVGAGIISVTSPLAIHSDFMTDGFQARFAPHDTGGFMVAVTPGWGIIKTAKRINRKPQLSPAALGVRCEE